AGDEPESERSSEQRHSFRAILPRRDISDISLSGRNISACDPADDASDENEHECVRQPENDVTDRRAEHTDEQNGPPSVLIRQSSENRREYELHPGVDRDDEPDLERAREERSYL